MNFKQYAALKQTAAKLQITADALKTAKRHGYVVVNLNGKLVLRRAV